MWARIARVQPAPPALIEWSQAQKRNGRFVSTGGTGASMTSSRRRATACAACHGPPPPHLQNPWEWAGAYMNHWRVAGDHHDQWSSTASVIEAAVNKSSYGGPGGFNYLDFM